MLWSRRRAQTLTQTHFGEKLQGPGRPWEGGARGRGRRRNLYAFTCTLCPTPPDTTHPPAAPPHPIGLQRCRPSVAALMRREENWKLNMELLTMKIKIITAASQQGANTLTCHHHRGVGGGGWGVVLTHCVHIDLYRQYLCNLN